MVENREQLGQKLEKQSLPELFRGDFDISIAGDKYIKDIIKDQDSKLFRIQIKVQPDEYGVKPDDYIASIDNEYLERFKSERLKKKTGGKNKSKSKMKKLEEEWEEGRTYFGENRERREDWETEMMRKYEKLGERKKKSEKKRMKGIRYREIEKYKEYPAVYNTLLRIRSRSENIEDIDLVIMVKSKKYEMEEKVKAVKYLITQILRDEETSQYLNRITETEKKEMLDILSQIREKGNTLLGEIGNNKHSDEEVSQLSEEISQIYEEMVNPILQGFSSNSNKKNDRIKFIYKREGYQGYKYYDQYDSLKKGGKQIIEC